MLKPFLNNPLLLDEKTEFQVWQREFICERLRIGLWIAAISLFSFIIFSTLRPIQHDDVVQSLFTNILLFTNLAQELAILFGLVMLRTQFGQKHPTIVFLWFSWSITIVLQTLSLQQRYLQLEGMQLNLVGWTLMFLGQATLIPVWWYLHLLSQIGVFVYFLATVAWFNVGVRLPMDAILLISLYLFWFCVICNLSVFFYEKLQRAEFNSRRNLQREARYDALTGLMNFRHFQEQLDIAIAYAKRFDLPISLCLCDVDKFKAVNDTYGHQVGNAVLIKFSQIITNELRAVDIAARLGGDEFCILFMGSGAEDSSICLNRILRQLNTTLFEDNKGQLFTVSGSFGIAQWFLQRMMSKEDLLEAADQALYQAKENGRNQIIVNRFS